MDEPDYVVIRPAPDLPTNGLPSILNGRWFDRTDLPSNGAVGFPVSAAGLGAVAVPTDRFEVRADGKVAQVWEVRP